MLYTNEAIKNRKLRIQNTRKIVSIIAYIVLVPVLIYNISLIFQAIINPDKTPSFFGVKTYVIISGSMKPELEIGDIVITKEVAEDELQNNDVICFRQGQSVITHRIVDIEVQEGNKQYKTKGDNNNTEDNETIGIEIIEGKVIGKIPFLGNISLVLQGKIAVIVLALIIYISFSFSSNKKARKDIRRQKRIKYEKNMKIGNE